MKAIYKNGILAACAGLLAAGAHAADRMDGMMAMDSMMGMDPMKAEIVAIDRFSDQAGHLQVRTAANGLPGPNEPVDFDRGPFITQGLAPDGSPVKYYNFDVRSTTPAPIYVLYREGDDRPVQGQLDIVDAIPGEAGYNDFWRINKVIVPKGYVANTATSLADIQKAKYRIEKTDRLVNYPLVPAGSKARLRLHMAGDMAGNMGGDMGGNGLNSGWYRGKVVKYFAFEEKALSTMGADTVPVSPIYVTFNTNPDQPMGGPGSGFKTEPGSLQTHNVPMTVPADMGYSPLWLVSVYDNADWPRVHNLSTVLQAKIVAPAVATVNCPIVSVGKMDGMKM
jgi:hypothetical protein